MNKIGRVLAGAVVTLLLASAVAASLALQTQPALPRRAEVSLSDIEQAHQVLRKHDPRRWWLGPVRTVDLSPQEADLLLDQAARQLLQVRTKLTLEARGAVVQTSLELPVNPFGRWLNVRVRLRETATWPEVDALRVGRLPLPAWLGERWKRQWVAQLDGRLRGMAASSMVKRVRLMPAQVQVTYEWRQGSGRRMLAAWMSAPEQERLQFYAARLAELAGTTPGAASEVPMVQWLVPLAQRARERSAAGGDPALENRAMILALALYAARREFALLVAATVATGGPERWVAPTLQRRVDLAQHFLVSAALAAEAGSPMADALGLYKEVLDSRGGSGFSFNDLAADRAGTRWGRLAVEAPAKLQAALAAGVDEADLIPDVSDLPESLSAEQFASRYGGVGGAGYNALMADIESRIAAVTLYR